MSLQELAQRFEKLTNQQSEQYYNQEAGLPYDRELMKKLAEKLTDVAQEFLDKFSEPRRMYLASIDTIASAERLEAELDFNDKRMEKISTEKYTIDGKKLNWGNWRQFNSATQEASKRKEVFDEFISKAPQIAPFLEKRMEISRKVYERYHTTPLEAYLELEQTSYKELQNLLERLGDGAKKAYLSAAEHYAPEVLQKNIVEYYDDFYTWGGRIYKPLNRYFESKEPLVEVGRFLKALGFDISAIKVDAEDRPNKSPSASCWSINVPDDVRILYRKTTPFSNFGAVFHEFGHGIHARSADRDDSVWKRYVVPSSVAETFSILTESVSENPLWLKTELKLKEEATRDIVDRVRFMNLTFLTFYAANSIMKMEFWKKKYTVEQAAKRWQQLTKRFFIEVPGYYWVLHHVMPNFDLYAPSYVIAHVRVAAVKQKLVHDYGEAWWKKPQAGKFIKQLAQTEGEFDIKAWKLDPQTFLEEQKNLSFLQ